MGINYESSKIPGCKMMNARLTVFLGNRGPYEDGTGLSICSPCRFFTLKNVSGVNWL